MKSEIIQFLAAQTQWKPKDQSLYLLQVKHQDLWRLITDWKSVRKRWEGESWLEMVDDFEVIWGTPGVVHQMEECLSGGNHSHTWSSCRTPEHVGELPTQGYSYRYLRVISSPGSSKNTQSAGASSFSCCKQTNIFKQTEPSVSH